MWLRWRCLDWWLGYVEVTGMEGDRDHGGWGKWVEDVVDWRWWTMMNHGRLQPFGFVSFSFDLDLQPDRILLVELYWYYMISIWFFDKWSVSGQHQSTDSRSVCMLCYWRSLSLNRGKACHYQIEVRWFALWKNLSYWGKLAQIAPNKRTWHRNLCWRVFIFYCLCIGYWR